MNANHVSSTNVHTQVVRVGDKEIKLEVGRFSEQAEAAVLATLGGTVVHATVGLGPESNLDYFPLQVEYVENLYAGGRIKGSRWVKRPGRPSDDAILSARVIDRSIRPLFPDGLRREVQVVVSVLSVDMENNPDMVGMVAAMAAMEISSIPFQGPVAGLRIAHLPETGEFIFNPTYEQAALSDLDLILAGSAEAIVMVEAGAREVSEATMLAAMAAGHAQIKNMAADLATLRVAVGKEKFAFTSPEMDQELLQTLRTRFADDIIAAIRAKGRLQKYSQIDEAIATLVAEDENNALLPLKQYFAYLMKTMARELVLNEGERPDGRRLDEVRPITCEVDVLPLTHGSAVFKRGATQVLTITTLGAPALGQLIEDMEGEETRHYIHHYNMPPFASGETGRIGAPKRREIGHGALAERALLPMIPSMEEFPYTIHVQSEVMSSNGSTSQASVCGSTLSLMAAGVPIKKPVSGIAMGLMKAGDRYAILTDIQGLEDHIGDMDFKVAGTKDGITAIQMDIKVDGLTMDILQEALAQAKAGREHIMGLMMECISAPRAELAANAPKIETTQIAVDKIGELIGPGGKNIKKIIEVSGAQVDVEDDGSVYISSSSQEAIDTAMQMVKNSTLEITVGMEFDGEVDRIEDYGAFVMLAAGKSGLVHVSQMGVGYIQNPRDVVNLGDMVHVRVIEVEGDRVRLTMLTPEEEEQAKASAAARRGGGEGGGFGRSDRNDRGDRGGFGRDRGSRSGERRSGGRDGRAGRRPFGRRPSDH